jgi:hypothetical protein
MSRPFACALFGLLFSIATLTAGEHMHVKAAVPIAFVVGGAMIVGGLTIGFLRELRRKRPEREVG